MSSEQVRVSKKFWKATHGAYYCKLIQPNGSRRDRRLAEDEEEAEGIRQDIIKDIKKAGSPTLDCTVDHLIQLFLAHAEANNAEDTFKWYLHFLSSFKNSIGMNLRVRDLGLHHVQKWLTKSYPQKGNQNTRHNAISCVKRLFNWAVRDMGYFDRNPLAALKKPQRTHRETCPSRQQWEEVLAHYKPDDPMHDFLTVLIDTGCRPQEVRFVEARQIDLAAQPYPLMRFADGEIRGKKWGRDVRLTDRAVSVLKRLSQKYPEGLLFRNENGDPWTKDALNCRFKRLKKKEKLSFKINCYAARHSLATDLLDSGASAGAVAALLGHRDPTVVLKFYGKHIEQRAEHLQGLLDKARQPQPEPKKKDSKKGTRKGTSSIAVDRAKKTGQLKSPQDDENPRGLKVIGKVPHPKSKKQKRDAG